MDKQYIGGLYKKVGMGTPADVVTKQLEIIDQIYPHITQNQVETLVLILFCGVKEVTVIDWLLKASQDSLPGLGASGIDHDVEILATSLLMRVIRSEKPFVGNICLVIESACFFGKRVCSVDENIINVVRENLLAYQTRNLNLDNIEEDTFYDLTEQYTALQTASDNNNFQALWGPLKEVLEKNSEDLADVASNHASKISEIINRISVIEEQTKTQWFAISKWSQSVNKAFAALDSGEAGARAAFELSSIVRGSIGPAAAPALLNMALSDVIAKDETKKMSFEALCVSAPIIWRKTWIKPSAKDKKLTPVLTALSFANEANDESDWPARFKRETGVNVDFEISLLEFSLQLFHEILVTKM
jgi:hypothetical protein